MRPARIARNFRHCVWVSALLFCASALFCAPAWPQTTTEANLHAQRAQAAIRANQPELAASELKALLKINPEDANAWASLGMVQFTQAQYQDARSNFEAALTRSPALWNAHAFLGMCQIRLGDAAQGQAEIANAFDHITDKNLRTQAGLELVNSYLNSGLTQEAAVRIELLKRDNPGNPDVLYAVYRIHSALATEALQELSRSAPESARVHQVLGDAMLAQENYKRAIEEYREALQRDPHLPGAHLGIAQALLSQTRDKQTQLSAEKELNEELALDPGNPDALFRLGQIVYDRGELDKAADLFNQSLKRRPQFADAHIALAKTYSDRNQDGEALNHLQQAVEAAPDNRAAHYRLAQLLKKSGQNAKAEEQFAAARKLEASEHPSSAPVLPDESHQ
jgi:tetratricopeptide (TPR) repeat protein